MFYEGKKEDPIKVEGTLVVYAFDETDRDANNARPDRKYVFTPQQLPLHYSKSKVGHSYSVWLPWDEVGGLQKEITLIVRFEPKEGAVAISDPCRQLLPGRIAPARAQLPVGRLLAPGGMVGAVGQAGPAAAGRATGATSRLVAVQPSGCQGRRPATAGARRTSAARGVPGADHGRPGSSVGGSGSSGGSRRPRSTCPRDRRSVRRSLGRRLRQRRENTGRRSDRRNPAPGPGQNYPPRNYPPQNYPSQNYPPLGVPAGSVFSAGNAVCGVAGAATTIWFCTWSTVASRRTTRSAKSRSCSVATTPRRIAVRPCISTWAGRPANAAPAGPPGVPQSPN